MSRAFWMKLKEMAPDIEWTKPISVSLLSDVPEHEPNGFLCRICVAKDGFRGQDRERIFTDEMACLQHIKAEHIAR
jgi:hypothetical protein